MKSIVLLLMVVSTYGYCQVFQLDKLDSANFMDLISQKKVIVVGEMHGTTEVPLFVLQLVKQLHKHNPAVVVGLEINSNYQKNVDEFLKDGDIRKLSKVNYFAVEDGRTSVAMGELLKGLRELGVSVICFDIEEGFDPNVNRDSLMGVNLASNYHGGQMVILTGNLHANLKEGYWKPGFKSAVFHFNRAKQFGDQLISLNTYFGGGTIWNCMADGCHQREAYANKGLDKHGHRYLGLYRGDTPNGYSGYVYLHEVTASKPLRH